MNGTVLVAAKILGMGMPELVVILVVVLLIFGPKNLPKLGASLGRTVKNVRDGIDGKELDEGQITEDADEEEDEGDEEEEEEEEEEVEEPAPKKKKAPAKKN